MPEANRPILNRAVTSNIADLKRQFAEAQPFRHVLIENFFADDVLAELIRQFPVPDPSKMVNEFGRGSKKFARHDVRNIGTVYAELDDYIRSPKFAALMSELTGIPGLLYDPEYHGAGTHDNHDGQGMDPHVDFNLHRSTGYHRRINAIIYLNESWDPKWGGNLELHKNPWDPEGDEVIVFPPFKNHCVLFETNEYSWHGFHAVSVPEGKEISRKSFTIYMYTKERPLNEIADKHGTIYVPRPMPGHLQPGHTLTAADVDISPERLPVSRDDGERPVRQGEKIPGHDRSADAVRAQLYAAAPRLGGAGRTGYWLDGKFRGRQKPLGPVSGDPRSAAGLDWVQEARFCRRERAHDRDRQDAARLHAGGADHPVLLRPSISRKAPPSN